MLYDRTYDWDSPLPNGEWRRTEEQCRLADVVLCLGTSFRVEPAGSLPLITVNNGGVAIIVNLQKTPNDEEAELW
jgi:mono-ADP-ribosyltransferase sirtuin 6